MVRHGRADDRDLLPPELPGDHAEARERRLLPDRGRRATARVSRLQTVPTRRIPGVAGMERPPGRGRSCDAADRRRLRRAGRCARTRPPTRVQRTSTQSVDDRGTRRRSARDRSGPTGPHGATADRDDRSRPDRRRLRRRLRQRAPVQRHDPRGVRDVADATFAPAPRRRVRRLRVDRADAGPTG